MVMRCDIKTIKDAYEATAKTSMYILLNSMVNSYDTQEQKLGEKLMNEYNIERAPQVPDMYQRTASNAADGNSPNYETSNQATEKDCPTKNEAKQAYGQDTKAQDTTGNTQTQNQGETPTQDYAQTENKKDENANNEGTDSESSDKQGDQSSYEQLSSGSHLVLLMSTMFVPLLAL